MSEKRPTQADIDLAIARLSDPVHVHPILTDGQRRLAIAILRSAQTADGHREPGHESE
jgi:hypothetical protein